jgi:hypothetical protein
VDKRLLKQVGVWILGVQREINEVEHTIDQIPVPKRLRPKPEDVMHLRRGQFFVCYDDVVKRVYVQPAWMSAELARQIATLDWDKASLLMRQAIDRVQTDDLVGHSPLPHESGYDAAKNQREVAQFLEDENVDYKAAYEEAQIKLRSADSEIQELRTRLSNLEARLQARGIVNLEETPKFASTPEPAEDPIAYVPPAVPAPPDMVLGDGGNIEQLYDWLRAKLLADKAVMLAIKTLKPQMEVSVERHVIKADHGSLRGRVGMLIHDGFFSKGRAGTAVLKELHGRGFKVAKMTVYDEMDRLAEMGFFRKQKQADRSIHFVLVDGMDVRVVEHSAA